MPQSETTDKRHSRTGIGLQERYKQISMNLKCHIQRQQTDITPVLGFKNLKKANKYGLEMPQSKTTDKCPRTGIQESKKQTNYYLEMPQSGTTDKCHPRLGIHESKKQSITWKCRKQRQQTNATPVVGFKSLRNN